MHNKVKHVKLDKGIQAYTTAMALLFLTGITLILQKKKKTFSPAASKGFLWLSWLAHTISVSVPVQSG